MELNQVLKNLCKFETRSIREGYYKDATDYAFRYYFLLLLKQIIQKKKRPLTEYQKYCRAYLKRGLSMKEIAKKWKG